MVQPIKQDEKKAYAKPEVTVIGSVGELTQVSLGNSGGVRMELSK